HLDMGIEQMTEQLDLATRLVETYRRTNRILFTGPDYQLAKDGVCVMDQLAALVDRPTAVKASEWSEQRLNEMAAAIPQPTPQSFNQPTGAQHAQQHHYSY
ncbi:MAG: hypothetical protein WCH44_18480, partial [Betaproteobacteria bacterium]